MTKQGVVSIVGLPNVGKSTLFNRLVGKRQAVVEDFPGTTRDRQYGVVHWNDLTFKLVDTGGMTFSDKQLSGEERSIQKQLNQQIDQALAESDVILVAVDGTIPPTVQDEMMVVKVVKTKTPCILVVNKVDNDQREAHLWQYYELGLGEPVGVSAIGGRNSGELLDAVVDALKGVLPTDDEEAERDANAGIKVAIVGRPNVGKSTLVNNLLGEERVVVSSTPGTTRDAIDCELEYQDQRITLIDMAGIRRRGKITSGIENYSVVRAMQAIERSDIALILIDAEEGLTAQDQHIIGYVVEQTKGIALLVNKWDLAKQVDPKKNTMTQAEISTMYVDALKNELNFVPYMPIRTISALSGLRVNKMLDLVLYIHEQRQMRIADADLKKLIARSVMQHAPSKRGKELKIYSSKQTGINPPEFTIVVNDGKLMHFSFQRYLENQIRQIFSFEGTSIKFVIKEKKRTRNKKEK
jgi:GTP-binding protein